MAGPADRIEAFAVTVPAGTAKASAIETATAFMDGTVLRVELDVPSGHAGFTGIQILWAHAQQIPYTQGAFIVADNHNFGWDFPAIRDTGQWSVKAFNTGLYPHTFYIRYSVYNKPAAGTFETVPTVTATPVLV